MSGRARRVLVTGGAGYVGVHTVLAMRARGWEVAVVDNLSTGRAEFAALADQFAQVDLLDSDALSRVVEGFRPDGIVHCAALAHVAESMREPVRYHRHNLNSTLNLIEASATCGAVPIVLSSSAATYGEALQTPITEDHPQHPINPYGFTKLACEQALWASEGPLGIRAVALRYFNAAGADPGLRAGEWHDPELRVIPNVLRAARDPGFAFQLYGTDYPTRDGTCVRDYIHVHDLARAHMRTLEYLWDGGRPRAFNLGTGHGVSVRELVSAVEKTVGVSLRVEDQPRRPGDPAELVASGARIEQELGLRPERSAIEQVVADAWRWLDRLWATV